LQFHRLRLDILRTSGRSRRAAQIDLAHYRPVLLLLSVCIFFSLAARICAIPVSAAGQQGQASGGEMTNAAPHQAVFDDQHRPITAGGFTKTGPVVFVNATEKAGLSKWRNVTGTPDKRVIIEAKGSGVCLLDYDNDGWLDIYLVNGSTLDARAGKAPPPHAALFHNNHDGTFTDVTGRAGVANDRWGTGCVVGDFDNDGSPDLYVTNVGPSRLYRNNHDGTFIDVAVKAGVALDEDPADVAIDHTGATFGDYDGDGNLDLFVAGYIDFDLKNVPVSGSKTSGYDFCQYRGVRVMCGPRGLQGARDHLFHSNGDGTFTDVSKKLGMGDSNGYYGLDALFVDVNNDGKPDLMVANDSTPNYLYINKGNGTFKDESYENGFALNGDGREAANMGLAVGDYENNGHLSVASTTFSDDYPILFRNDGTGAFTDVSYQAGIAQSSIPFVKFGDGFLDFDNDGWKDLLIVNGHVYPQVDQHPEWGQTYAQRQLLYRNLGNGKFELVPAVEGTGLAVVTVGRGAAFGDLFNDGKIDVVINSMDGEPILLRNVNPDHHRWVEIKLIGGPKSPRDAVGATVYLTANGIRQRGDVLSGGSYLSSNDPRVHFGLGDSRDAGTAEIHWPSGGKSTLKLSAVDRIYTIVEGKGIIDVMCNGKPCQP
jgi:enediyne biosynthesis protein E4